MLRSGPGTEGGRGASPPGAGKKQEMEGRKGGRGEEEKKRKIGCPLRLHVRLGDGPLLRGHRGGVGLGGRGGEQAELGRAWPRESLGAHGGEGIGGNER